MIFQILVRFQESVDLGKIILNLKKKHITPFLKEAPTFTYHKQ